jgi:hypothetical protein
MTEAPIFLRWPEHPASIAYRVIIYSEERGEYVKFEVPDAGCRVPPGTLADAPYEWRVEFRASPQGDWVPLFPYVALMRGPDPEVALPLTWPADDAYAHRVIIRAGDGRIVAKVGAIGPSLVLDPQRLPAEPDLSWRVQRAVGGDWEDWIDYAPLPRARAHDVAPVAPEAGFEVRPATPLGRPLGPRALYVFTCDTEVTMRMMRDPDPTRAIDEQVFARVDGQEVGIGHLMDRLEAHGMRGTFFVDVLMRYQFGERALRTVCDAILERGHDIQLHLHPAPHLRFSDDEAIRRLHPALLRDDPVLFGAALELGIEEYERAVGRAPIAYRSGAYHLCDAYLEVLADHGIRLDSSLWPWRNCRVSPWMWTRTQPFWVGDLLELPVSWILRDRPEGLSNEQFAPVLHPRFQTGALRDMRLPAHGPPLVLMYIAHSYSMLLKETDGRPDAAERWNAAVERVWPAAEAHAARMQAGSEVRFFGGADQRRMTAFDDLLETIASRGDVETVTLDALGRRDLRAMGFDAPRPGGEAVPVWHDSAGHGGLSATQRFSSWYLEHVEAELGAHA